MRSAVLTTMSEKVWKKANKIHVKLANIYELLSIFEKKTAQSLPLDRWKVECRFGNTTDFLCWTTEEERSTSEALKSCRSFPTMSLPMEMWLAVMTAVANLLCQNPQTFNSKSKNKKKLEKNSKTNSQNVRLDMIIEVLTTPTKISSFLKRPSKTNSKFEKILSLTFSWQNFFPSIQFFGQIECSFDNVAHHFLPNY